MMRQGMDRRGSGHEQGSVMTMFDPSARISLNSAEERQLTTGEHQALHF